ncbi:MAG: hypothetical protein J6Y94_03850 [Bacteriovoracaceae bacterium]|nr:hypothetical protein [Bacteriovoracaceae bacterium]
MKINHQNPFLAILVQTSRYIFAGTAGLALLALSSCWGNSPYSPQNAYPAPSPAITFAGQIQKVDNQNYTIINLGSAFNQFWQEAKYQPFEEQVKIWDRIIEAPHQNFYDTMVWEKNIRQDWPALKLRRLKFIFAQYPELYTPMLHEFSAFPAKMNASIAKFIKFFPDARFTTTIYAAPAPTFNGQGNEDGSILGLGVDMYLFVHDDTDILFAHELFHIYHSTAAKMSKETYKKEAKLTYQLWYEGLATYVSHQMNPDSSIDQILGNTQLAQLPEKELAWAAKEFLKEANEKANDPQRPEIFRKWFTISEEYRLRPEFPARAGYWLGYNVAKLINQKFTLSAMAHWDKDRVHQEVIKALTTLAQEKK